MSKCANWMLVAVLALAPALAFSQEQIPWGTDIAKAQKQAAAERKLVLVHFYSDTCLPCRSVEQKVFPLPEVVQSVGRNYVPVKINVDKAPELATRYGVRGWPTDVYLTSAGQLIHSATTAPSAPEYVTLLDRLAVQAGVGSERQAALQNRDARYEPQQYGGGALPAAPGQPTQVQNQYVNNRYSPEQYQQQYQPAAGDPSLGQQTFPQQGLPQNGPYGGQGFQSPPVSGNPAGQPQYSAGGAPVMQRTNWQDPVDITVPQQPIINQFVPVTKAPPVAMEGYCPVSICPPSADLKGRWVKGNPRYGAVHRGRTYLFASDEAQRRFLADPDAYSPALSGADPVIFAERGEMVEGNRNFGVSLPAGNGRSQMFFFASEENLIRFEKAPRQYAVTAYQAMLRSETGRKYR